MSEIRSLSPVTKINSNGFKKNLNTRSQTKKCLGKRNILKILKDNSIARTFCRMPPKYKKH
jgi:hypothetical protein